LSAVFEVDFVFWGFGCPVQPQRLNELGKVQVKGGGQACPELSRRECPPHTGFYI
jgi:hypothetical protein